MCDVCVPWRWWWSASSSSSSSPSASCGGDDADGGGFLCVCVQSTIYYYSNLLLYSLLFATRYIWHFFPGVFFTLQKNFGENYSVWTLPGLTLPQCWFWMLMFTSSLFFVPPPSSVTFVFFFPCYVQQGSEEPARHYTRRHIVDAFPSPPILAFQQGPVGSNRVKSGPARSCFGCGWVG